MSMNISIIHLYPFPIGMAASTRILTYSKGLVAAGANVTVFCLNPYYKEGEIKLTKSGLYEGVRYYFPKDVYRVKNPIAHKIQVFLSMLYSLFYLISKRKEIDFLIISNDSVLFLGLYTMWSKIIGIRPIFIADEYPIPIRVYLHKDIPKWKKILYKHILKYEDSLIFMTDKINTFYNLELNLKKPYHILSTIVDTSRFNVDVLSSEKKYMCYMGNMELTKDNVDNIIRAFAIISDKYRDIDFYLYGAPSAKDLSVIENVIKECKMEDRIFIKGRVSANEVPLILKQAYVLVSSQPNTKRAEGGFPTKLGEYMAAGIPAIITDVGEISQYVKKNVHVSIVPPEDSKLYAEQLDWIFTNYDKALEMAQEAKTYFYDTFDYKKEALRMYNFLVERKKC